MLNAEACRILGTSECLPLVTCAIFQEPDLETVEANARGSEAIAVDLATAGYIPAAERWFAYAAQLFTCVRRRIDGEHALNQGTF